MFRESIRIKCGRVGYLLHTEPRGDFSCSRKLIVVGLLLRHEGDPGRPLQSRSLFEAAVPGDLQSLYAASRVGEDWEGDKKKFKGIVSCSVV